MEQKIIEIIFLVYDSRSGSTLLSQQLTPIYSDILITEELEFDRLFDLSDAQVRELSKASLKEVLFGKGRLRNLRVPEQKIDEIIDRLHGSSIKEIVSKLLLDYAKLNGSGGCNCIMVKHGKNALYWKNIIAVFGSTTRFLHLFRDPRAVIHSKLTTPRPYFPVEKMAWGGCLLATFRWISYSRSMRVAAMHGVNVKEIRYEEFLRDSKRILQEVGTFLGVRLNMCSKEYRIPEPEKFIHPLAGGEIDEKRSTRWESELSELSRSTIEIFARKEMDLRGYIVTREYPVAKSAGVLVLAVAISGWKVLLHFFRLLINRTLRKESHH